MTLNVPGLAELIDVYRALTTGDMECLERLSKVTLDIEGLQETIHKSVGYATFDIEGSVRSQPIRSHAALWLVPVVANAGARPPNQNTPIQQVWIRNCFGPEHIIRSIGVLPSMASLTQLQPTDPYVLIEGLTKIRELAQDEQTRLDLQPNSTSAASGLPTLQFILGCVQRTKDLPTFPSVHDFAFTQRMAMALSMQSEAEDNALHEKIAVGMPAPFGQAIVQGLLMWLDSLEASCEVLCWTLDAMGGEAVVLQLVLEDRHDGERKMMSHILRLWQVGAEGLARIKERCAGWPINVPAGYAPPVCS